MSYGKPLSICLVGYGYWGRNLLRAMLETAPSNPTYLCETNTTRAEAAKSTYHQLGLIDSVDGVAAHPGIDAVICATPSSTHYTLVKKFLLAGKHVLVEKPFVLDSAEARELTVLAEQRGLVLMVDHIFLYNPAVQELRLLMTSDFMGQVNYMDATRINLGIYQDDTNVLWDLACHDVSIVLHLIDERPTSVMAVGRVHPVQGKEDIAYLFLRYPSGLLVQVSCSWASPVKIRKLIIGGEKRMVIYDDIDPTNKLSIYDYSGIPSDDGSKSGLTDYRLGNITIPKHGTREPLKNVLDEFRECIHTGGRPLSDGVRATEVVRILELAQLSMERGGETIPL